MSASDSPRRIEKPSPQRNLQVAIDRAYAAMESQSEEQIRWLGAEPAEGAWRLPVLGDGLRVDLAGRRIVASTGREVGPHWTILVLHYLAVASRGQSLPPSVTFADLATARSYSGVYDGRVLKRLCFTTGRNLETLRAAAGSLGAEPAEGGDAAFDFRPFPRVAVRLIWHAPDEEFPPSATLLLPENIEAYFCSEDIVVLSECLVARLSGRAF
jgi:hypothetical protein